MILIPVLLPGIEINTYQLSTSAETSMLKTWVKPFGLMELLVVDQGPEFTGEEFGGYFREQGVLVHFTDGQSPWQNGPTERAGGAFKEMLDKVLMDAVVLTTEEYHEAIDLLVAQRNARADRSGFSPDQRSLGMIVRLPGHMLADDVIDTDLLGAQANDGIRRSLDIQDAAARACVIRRNKEAFKAAPNRS